MGQEVSRHLGPAEPRETALVLCQHLFYGLAPRRSAAIARMNPKRQPRFLRLTNTFDKALAGIAEVTSYIPHPF